MALQCVDHRLYRSLNASGQRDFIVFWAVSPIWDPLASQSLAENFAIVAPGRNREPLGPFGTRQRRAGRGADQLKVSIESPQAGDTSVQRALVISFCVLGNDGFCEGAPQPGQFVNKGPRGRVRLGRIVGKRTDVGFFKGPPGGGVLAGVERLLQVPIQR